ncbi:MAG: FAD-dependent oxidoreductase [Cyanobacteriota bacterium]|nr:FAD-dependent oxidoreductase [Cyanobacteriota bacterium]
MTGNDLDAEVVVVGGGPAGIAAAAEAAAAGSTVTLIEAGGQLGGNAVRSNGYLAFVDEGVEAQDAFVADAEAAFRAVGAADLVWDASAVWQFAAESAATYRSLVARGVRFGRAMRRGGHGSKRIRALLNPGALVSAYAPDLAGRSIRCRFHRRAGRLLVHDGRVAGVCVVTTQGQEPWTVRAARAVVITTGGYQASPELRALCLPGQESTSPWYGTADCRGDGHRMGQAVGADLVNMTLVPPTVLVPSTLVEQSIAVNAAGERFHDETGSFAARVAALRAQPQRRAHYLVTADLVTSQARLVDALPAPPIASHSLAGLAQALGVPLQVLEATLLRWNRFITSRAQIDPCFGRSVLPRARTPLRWPLLALPMVEGVNMTCGGFRTTAEMQVLDQRGAVIPGLYAAGDCCAGLMAAASLTGLHISGALTQGRLAGRGAATASA